MTGEEAQYIERRGANSVDDDREIRMEGRHARYEESMAAQASHFPVNGNEAVGKQYFDFLVKGGYIAADTEIGCWQYVMGFSTEQPTDIRPIEWLKTLETARLMFNKVFGEMIDNKLITKARISELAKQLFCKDGKPLVLAKPRKEYSIDADNIENFLPTSSDL